MGRVKYLYKQGDYYVYNRRVPDEIAHIETRRRIKVSLKTADENEAIIRAAKVNKETEKYFESIALYGTSDRQRDRYQQAVKLAAHYGFDYKEAESIEQDASVGEVLKRLETASDHIDNPAVVASVLGGVKKPELRLNGIPDLYFEIAKGDVLDKNENQLRIWKNSRTRAIANMIDIIGNKIITDLNRNDALNFRDHWLERITDEGLSVKTANKELGHIDKMIRVICEHYRLPFTPLFTGLRFAGQAAKNPRPPFTTEFIMERLLAPDALPGINEAGRALIHLMSETGARPAELVGLDESEVFLDAPVPYIVIKKNQHRTLKTKNSERELPLTGHALRAAQDGAIEKMKKYQARQIALIETVRMYFKRHEIMPSKYHTLYSLRHSFEDRMIAVDAPERIKAELMGHRYSRSKYGLGAVLKQRQEWVLKFALPML